MVFTSGGKEKKEKNKLGCAGHGRALHRSAVRPFFLLCHIMPSSCFQLPKCYVSLGNLCVFLGVLLLQNTNSRKS